MKKLYVALVDDSPIYHLNEPCITRVVEIELTPEQEALIKPRETHSISGKTFYETVRPISIQDCPAVVEP